MHVERVNCRPAVPAWAVLLVLVYLALVGIGTWLAHKHATEVAPLCLFRHLTGQPCPTCGTTRMVLALAHGNIVAAIACNPLMFIGAIIGACWLFARLALGRRIVWITSPASRRLLAAGLVLAVLANWVYLLARQ